MSEGRIKYSQERILDHILHVEGWPKITDDPSDPGGWTKGGITLKAYRTFRSNATKDDLRNLDEFGARQFYTDHYIEGPKFFRIADGLLRWQVVDAGVNHGPLRATRWIQEAIGGVTVDGRLGPQTAGALNDSDAHSVALRFCALRCRFYGEIINEDWKRAQRERRKGEQGEVHLAKYAEGWMTRACMFLDLEAKEGPRYPYEIDCPLPEEDHGDKVRDSLAVRG